MLSLHVQELYFLIRNKSKLSLAHFLVHLLHTNVVAKWKDANASGNMTLILSLSLDMLVIRYVVRLDH